MDRLSGISKYNGMSYARCLNVKNVCVCVCFRYFVHQKCRALVLTDFVLLKILTLTLPDTNIANIAPASSSSNHPCSGAIFVPERVSFFCVVEILLKHAAFNTSA